MWRADRDPGRPLLPRAWRHEQITRAGIGPVGGTVTARRRETPMSKRPFLLDRDDFRRDVTIRPDDAHRDELERRLRDAHVAYQAHLARRAELERDIQETARQLAGETAPETATRLNALLAEQSVWSELLVEK